MPDLPQLTRRTALRLLVIGAVTAVTGCRPTRPRAASTATVTASPRPSPAATAAPVPETATELLVKRVAAAERALLVAYDTASSNHPELAGRLSPLRADHAAHLQGLVPGAVVATPAPAPAPSASPTPPASASPTPPASPSPSASDLALDELAALERAAAAARVDDVGASSGSLARVLASIGGCEAAHAALLAAPA